MAVPHGAGIEPGGDPPASSGLLLRPHPGDELSWASGAYHSVRGPISTRWRQSAGRFEFSAEPPPNVTASVRIPSGDPAEVRDLSGDPPRDIAELPGSAGVREAVFDGRLGNPSVLRPAPASAVNRRTPCHV